MFDPLTNYHENLDNILSAYRWAYLTARGKDNFVEAAHILECIRASHPPQATEGLEDFKAFVIPGSDLQARAHMHHLAREYCDRWQPALEYAMSKWRDQNQKEYTQVW